MPRMIRLVGFLIVMTLVVANGYTFAASSRVAAAAPMAPAAPADCTDGTLPSGALSRICTPVGKWKGGLVIWAHGYKAFNQPLAIDDPTTDGIRLSDFVLGQGYAYATTSYRRNGLAILEGVADIQELIAAFGPTTGLTPTHIYLIGASEGGIITTLLVERAPDLISGGLSMCGPIGDFPLQLNYWGDFRALFDYYFPNAIPGDAITIPPTVIDTWDTYQITITNLLQTNPVSTSELIAVSGAPIDTTDPNTAITTTLNLLWYNVFSTNDGTQQLGGNPFDNTTRVYSGSSDDAALNAQVKRYSADPAALDAMQAYQTSGNIRIPQVTLHTTGDEIVPFWHQSLYAAKVPVALQPLLTQTTVQRYGHCNFTALEILAAFNTLVAQVANPPKIVWRAHLPLVMN